MEPSSSSAIAQQTWELENNIIPMETPAADDSIFHYDEAGQSEFQRDKPWANDPHYFKRVKISALALLKMVVHARSGGTIEVMGLMQGKTDADSIIVMDAFALPVEGTETRVNAQDDAYEYMVDYSQTNKQAGRLENVVGWYSTGPKLKENDLDIHGLFNDYVPNPILVIIDVEPKELGIPTKAYYAVEEVKENATQKSQKVFVHMQSEIAAHEVEEIGVEHLLRDVKDTTISTLATEDVFNLLPNLNVTDCIQPHA